MAASRTSSKVMAMRSIFNDRVFTAASNEKTRNQIKQTAIQRGIEQRRMPDKIVNPGRLQQAAYDEEQGQRR
jgi:hypothetical protein